MFHIRGHYPIKNPEMPDITPARAQTASARLANFGTKIKLDFGVVYMAHCLVSEGILPVYTLVPKLSRQLAELPPHVALFALKRMQLGRKMCVVKLCIDGRVHVH